MTRNVYSVGQVNKYIKNMFSQDFMLGKIYIRGEISNCKYHSSGHIYFTLKDETGTMAAVMFAGNAKKLAFRMKEGDKVVVLGSVEVYERDGKYQLYAREVLLDGAGVLYQKFEALKQELEEMGMFSADYKVPIPKYIKTLGIVTAPTGAAIQDIRNIASRRNPYVQLILYPAQVQGQGAAASIVNGIHALEQQKVDVIIVGRGGGSMEDLWAFNEEIVARAIFECQVPVISAVGHETDTTIADYVADLRAPTPSAGAELAVYDIRLLKDEILSRRLACNQALHQQMQRKRQRLREYQLHIRALNPKNRLNENKQRAAEYEERIRALMEKAILVKRHRVELYAASLDGVSPAKKLAKGYAVVADEQLVPIKKIRQVAPGQKVSVHLQDGKFTACVEEVYEGQ